jgi:hypothetical protein
MKIKYCVCRYETHEAEISDEFAKLACARPWEDKTITSEDYNKCVDEVERVTGLPLDDHTDSDAYIVAVRSAKNGETILEL